MIKILLAILAVCGCSMPISPKNYAVVGLYEGFHPEGNYTTSQRISVYCNEAPVSREAMERATEIFVKYAALWFYLDPMIIYGVLQDSTLEWTASSIYIRDYRRTTIVSGASIGNSVYVTWNGKISDSSLFHEWLHLLLGELNGERDSMHQSLWWQFIPKFKEKVNDDGL